MKGWMLCKWKDELSEIEALKWTEKTVTYQDPYWDKPSRQNRHGQFYQFFETYAEAKQCLCDRLRSNIEGYRHNLAASEAKLQQLEGE